MTTSRCSFVNPVFAAPIPIIEDVVTCVSGTGKPNSEATVTREAPVPEIIQPSPTE